MTNVAYHENVFVSNKKFLFQLFERVKS